MDSTSREDMMREVHSQEVPGTSVGQPQASSCARHHVQVHIFRTSRLPQSDHYDIILYLCNLL